MSSDSGSTMMESFNGRTHGMCDLKEGTCNSDLEVRETLLEEVTCKLRPGRTM